MHSLISKTLGGLSRPYYFRHFLFGLIFTALLTFFNYGGHLISVTIFSAINTFLYPYSRFVYEEIREFIVGDNTLVMGITLALSIKFITIGLCWVFSLLIAPVGLAYLYYYHSKSIAESER